MFDSPTIQVHRAQTLSYCSSTLAYNQASFRCPQDSCKKHIFDLSDMILQVAAFYVATRSLLSNLSLLDQRAKLVLAAMSAVVTLVPAVVQTHFAILSMLRYEPGPWKYIRDSLLQSLLRDEYEPQMQRMNVITGGKNILGYSDPFTGRFLKAQVDREYTITKRPFGPDEKQVPIENFWSVESGVHILNQTEFKLQKFRGDLELRVKWMPTGQAVTHSLGSMDENKSVKLRDSLAFMTWCYGVGNRVVTKPRNGDKLLRCIRLHDALTILKDENMHLVEIDLGNGKMGRFV